MMKEKLFKLECNAVSKSLRLNVIRVLFGLGRNFHRIAFADDTDVALQVSLGSGNEVFRVGE